MLELVKWFYFGFIYGYEEFDSRSYKIWINKIYVHYWLGSIIGEKFITIYNLMEEVDKDEVLLLDDLDLV